MSDKVSRNTKILMLKLIIINIRVFIIINIRMFMLLVSKEKAANN